MSVKEQRRTLLLPFMAATLGASILGGCMVGPNFHPPQPTTVPPAWVGVEKTPSEPSMTTTAQPEPTQWWRQFDDPILTSLVDDALNVNLDLRIAETRLREARATRGVVAGGLWPAVTASGGYQKYHMAGVTPGNQALNLYQAGFDAAWEIDLLGGQRRSVESADANIRAAIENIRDAQVSLVAEVALNYIQLRGYQQEIAIAQKNLVSQKHTADITHRLLNVGFASALDAANADSDVATTESQIPVFESEARQSIYALSVLLARPPGDLLEQLSPTGSLPRVPTQVPAGLPSDLLRRRSDIRAAEAQLHAATAQIGVATAEYFPTFSLTGALTWSSNLLRTLWTNASRSYAAGASVTWPLFQGGATVSNVRLQEALRDESFIAYQQTVLSAFQDVENSLIAYSKEQQHHKLLNDAVVNNRKAVDLSLQLYTAGLIGFLNVEIAQRTLYSSEDALVQSETSIVTDLIALYKALGGGWESLPMVSNQGTVSTESGYSNK